MRTQLSTPTTCFVRCSVGLVTRLRLLLAATVLLVAGCTSSGSGGGTGAPTSSSGGSSTLAATVANTMRKGMSGLTSAHLVIDAGGLGGKSIGDVKYSNGQATASRLTINAGGAATLVTIGDTTYAKLPGGRNTTGKPWVIVSPDSNNEFVRALSSQVGLTKAATSLPAIADAVASASTITDKGTTAQGHAYALQLDPGKVADPNLGGALRDLGENPVPVTLLLDKSGRPTQVKILVKLGSSSFPILIDVSKFNAPLTITAPPPDQVAK
jgi:hypothetical protein